MKKLIAEAQSPSRPSRRSPTLFSRAEALAWVRLKNRPTILANRTAPLRIADLFCGCGGLSLGVAEGARRRGRQISVDLAVDIDADALAVYRDNFQDNKSAIIKDNIAHIFDGINGAALTAAERAIRKTHGEIEAIIAGPPCQGHSDLNNSTRRDDPRNLLYLRSTRAVEVLRPRCAIIENVPAVIHAKAGVVEQTIRILRGLGYRVTTAVFDMQSLGLPQRRRRHVLFATTYDCSIDDLLPPLAPRRISVGPFIADLENEPDDSSAAFASPSKMTAENTMRVNYLFENDLYDLPDFIRPPCHRDKEHSYQSVYGRLRWDAPSQTITTGFGSMGQGRFIHPRRRRLITPHEAARIQGFPDFFSFSAASGSTALRSMIGNAVPPPLMIALFSEILKEGIL